MLCKTTMRALLAPLTGLFAVLFATTASAVIELGESDAVSLKFAGETLSKDASNDVAGVLFFYKIAATGDALQLKAETDILLPAQASTSNYYVKYTLGTGMVWARDLAVTDMTIGGTDAGARAFQGLANNNQVIFQVGNGPYDIGTELVLQLSGAPDDPGTTDVNEALSAVAVNGVGSFTATVAVYADLGSALADSGAFFTKGPTEVVNVKRAVSVETESLFDIADVSTLVADGGPFRRFVADRTGGAESGVLGTTNVKVDVTLRHALTSRVIDASIVGSTNVEVTSEAGNFAVSLNAGGVQNTEAAKPWMLSSTATCTNGPLTLSIGDTALETYEEDPDGDDGPGRKGGITAAGIQAATKASGTAGAATGTNYFCVLVKGNTEPIPEIGDPTKKDSYMIKLTPTLAAESPVKPLTSGPFAMGAIDRNGTTVHVSYLTTNEEINQRLVLVNRGGDAAVFWVEDDSFSLEEGTSVTKNGLSSSLQSAGMIPGNGRLVITVSDHIEFEGQPRGAATVNVAAPTRDIDVMTIQRSPATGEVDTTLYQHAES